MDEWGADECLSLQPATASGLVAPAPPQRLQRRIPGPAGLLDAAARPAPNVLSAGGQSERCAVSGGGAPSVVNGGGDLEFRSPAWLQALRDVDAADFDEGQEPFKGNTVRAANNMQESGRLSRLLAVVAAVKRCHSGEAFVRLKDPTGSIGGTLTRAVLEAEPGLQPGAVVMLRRVAVLRTPPPCSLSHLCIALDAVLQVVAPQSTAPSAGAAHEQPCPLPAALVAAPHVQLPRPPLLPGSPEGQQGAAAGSPAAAASSFARPFLGAASAVRPPHTVSEAQQGPQPRSTLQQKQPAAPRFAWPSLSAGTAGGGAQQQQQQQQRMGPPPPLRTAVPVQQQRQASEPASFRMGGVSAHAQPRPACRVEASRGRGAQQPTTATTGPATSDWLQGLLAEVDFDPFASQPSQAPGVEQGRLALASRQPHSTQNFPPAAHAHTAKRQCAGPEHAQPQQQQQQQQRWAAGGVVFGEADELDLDD